MASLVFEKLRSVLRRPIGTADAPVETQAFPLFREADAPSGMQRRINELAAEIDRLTTAYQGIETRLEAIADEHTLFGDALRDADGSRAATTNDLRQAIARLQARVTALGLDKEKTDGSISRLDEAHGALRDAHNRSEARLDDVIAARRQEAAERAALSAIMQETKESVARSAELALDARDAMASMENAQIRMLASRIAIAHLISLVALVAVLATMAYIAWRD
jgi:chromosome segregation ATPase